VLDDSQLAEFLQPGVQRARIGVAREAILELLMLAGTYRTVSYLVNGLRLPPEPGAVRFPA
jgi:hypothetical protein